MPLYEYECDACGRRFELIRRFSDAPAETCAVCGSGPVRKLLSSPAFQFKGSGWYITDYARKEQKTGAKAEQTEGASSSDSAKAAAEGAKKKSDSAKDHAVKNKADTTEKSSKPEKSGTGKKSSSSGSTAKGSSGPKSSSRKSE